MLHFVWGHLSRKQTVALSLEIENSQNHAIKIYMSMDHHLPLLQSAISHLHQGSAYWSKLVNISGKIRVKTS